MLIDVIWEVSQNDDDDDDNNDNDDNDDDNDDDDDNNDEDKDEEHIWSKIFGCLQDNFRVSTDFSSFVIFWIRKRSNIILIVTSLMALVLVNKTNIVALLYYNNL